MHNFPAIYNSNLKKKEFAVARSSSNINGNLKKSLFADNFNFFLAKKHF